MTALLSVAYVSSATRHFTPKELDALLLSAREFNATVDVTGVLLYHDGSFFQYFEGPEAGVEQVYSRIKKSRSHHSIIELVSEPVDQRHFASWYMGFAETTASELQAISQADWHTQHQKYLEQDASASGVALLLLFWQQAKFGRGNADS